VAVAGVVIGVLVCGVIGVLYAIFRSSGSSTGKTGASSYQVGRRYRQTPPGFSLAATTGGSVSLAGLHGKTVLLYFRKDCLSTLWQQLTDSSTMPQRTDAASARSFRSPATRQPAGPRKPRPWHFHAVLSDPDLTVSETYHANGLRDGWVVRRRPPSSSWSADGRSLARPTTAAPQIHRCSAHSQLLADLRAGQRQHDTITLLTRRVHSASTPRRFSSGSGPTIHSTSPRSTLQRRRSAVGRRDQGTGSPLAFCSTVPPWYGRLSERKLRKALA